MKSSLISCLVVILGLSISASVSHAKGKDESKSAAEKKSSREPADEGEQDPCEDPSTHGMLMCDAKNMVVVRKNLATEIRRLRSAFEKVYPDGDPNALELKRRLTRQHNAYKKYAVAKCEMESGEMLGGTGERLIMSSCYLDMLRKEISDVQETQKAYVIGQ